MGNPCSEASVSLVSENRADNGNCLTKKKYHVFVSHTGEDKVTIALPLRNMLFNRGITAFVDERDIRPGRAATEAMTSAMETADVAVIVLSPEFVTKKSPMRELLFFLKRQEDARANGGIWPVIIPVFYRLNVEDMCREPRLARNSAQWKNLYGATRFFQRLDNGEPEADIEVIRKALCTGHGIMGIENKLNASNEESSAPLRLLLLKQICSIVSQAILDRIVGSTSAGRSSTASICSGTNNSPGPDKFQRYFHQAHLANVVLDFNSTKKRGVPSTCEFHIKDHILNYDGSAEHGNVVAILGGGGVGKSTILKGLANDGDLRKRYCDGIHMISMGMDTTIVKLFRQLCQMLRDSGAISIVRRLWKEMDVNPPIDEAIHEAISWFRGTRCAFLIDDVWTTSIEKKLLENLLKLSSTDQQSIVVFTAREPEIAAVASLGSVFLVNPRDVQGLESRKILFFHSGFTESNACAKDTNEAIVEVLKICSGLPVALAVAGRSLKMLAIDKGTDTGNVWHDYLVNLRNYREQLLVRKRGDYGNLYTTFGVSIAILEKRKEVTLGFKAKLSFAEMYRRLCILEKQSHVPPTMLKHLWELRSDDHAKCIAMGYVEMGLAKSVYFNLSVSSGVATWRLAIHDSLHDYAVTEAQRHRDVVLAHKKLLKGYGHPLPKMLSIRGVRTKWWSEVLIDDGYIHTNLYRHLRAVGRVRELNTLEHTTAWLEGNHNMRRRSMPTGTVATAANRPSSGRRRSLFFQ